MTTENHTKASMLLAFTARNAYSFRDLVEFSMLATARSEPGVPRLIPWREDGKPIGVLPVASVYGANASGKTNLLKAMRDLRSLVINSFRHSRPTGSLLRRPFRLDPASRETSTEFTISVVIEGIRWEYGLEYREHQVIEEWAYRYPRGRANLVFHRELESVNLGAEDRAKGRAAQELLRPNALFLSTAAAANHPALFTLYEWFDRNLLLADERNRELRQRFSARLLEDSALAARTLALLKAADLGVTGARVKDLDPEVKVRVTRMVEAATEDDELPLDLDLDEVADVTLTHAGVAGDVEFDLADESLGTQIWLGIVGPVVETLAQGTVLLADELDASLHPALVEEVIRLFQSEKSNPRRAQLIFNTHDTSVMGSSRADRLLGRDQIWFTEKQRSGDTRLYPLLDLDPRRDEAIEKRYHEGRYGGVPVVSSAEFATAAAEVIEQTSDA